MIIRKLVLALLYALLISCSSPKGIKYYPESIPPFLQEEIDVEKVFAEETE